MRHQNSATRICASALALTFMSHAAQAQDTDEMARQLIELRGAVEELNQELDLLKQEHRAEMQILAQQKVELEANRNRLDTQIKQIEQQRDEFLAEALDAGVDNENLLPVVLNGMEQLRELVATSMPFKRDERLAELDDIRLSIDSGTLAPNRAANRLWAFFEDEVRITKENAIYSQTIVLAGERFLADVAKLGSVMMFFRTEDLRYGEAVLSNGKWQFQEVSGADEVKSIEYLFDSLQKQIRQGYFELPDTISSRVGGAS